MSNRTMEDHNANDIYLSNIFNYSDLDFNLLSQQFTLLATESRNHRLLRKPIHIILSFSKAQENLLAVLLHQDRIKNR